MSNNDKFILPAGFREYNGQDAELEFWALEKLLSNFAKWSYTQTSTSIAEFEESLFDGNGASLENKTFKFVDPLTMKTLGIRSDITTQISNIIKSRLSGEEMPLRLCYYGNILRKTPSNTKGDRQLKQVGLELVSESVSAIADAEVITIAIESLLETGLDDISIDLNTPNLISNLGISLSEEEKDSLNKRDLSHLPEEIVHLIKNSGSAEKAIQIDTSNFNQKSKDQIQFLKEVYEQVIKTKLPVNITIDYAEDSGFEYHDMLGFSIFSKASRDEIGRGGRYIIDLGNNKPNKNLYATGFSLYLNSFIDKLKAPSRKDVQEVSAQTSYEEIKEIHNAGNIVRKKLS